MNRVEYLMNRDESLMNRDESCMNRVEWRFITIHHQIQHHSTQIQHPSTLIHRHSTPSHTFIMAPKQGKKGIVDPETAHTQHAAMLRAQKAAEAQVALEEEEKAKKEAKRKRDNERSAKYYAIQKAKVANSLKWACTIENCEWSSKSFSTLRALQEHVKTKHKGFCLTDEANDDGRFEVVPKGFLPMRLSQKRYDMSSLIQVFMLTCEPLLV